MVAIEFKDGDRLFLDPQHIVRLLESKNENNQRVLEIVLYNGLIFHLPDNNRGLSEFLLAKRGDFEVETYHE